MPAMTAIAMPSQEQLAALCKRWKIRELSLFGSVARGEARADSDVDLLVEFEPDKDWSLLDMAQLRAEAEVLFGRKVDLIQERLIRGERRRRSILRDKTQLYAA
jgi:predicted nucleotidyltransferase